MKLLKVYSEEYVGTYFTQDAYANVELGPHKYEVQAFPSEHLPEHYDVDDVTGELEEIEASGIYETSEGYEHE